MKTKFHAIGAVLTFVAATAIAFAAIDGLSVKRQPTAGQALKLRLKADIEVNGTPATFTALVQTKVTKVETDGSFTEEESQLQGKASIGGQDIDVPDPGLHTTSYNADGTIKEITGTGDASGPAVYRMANLDVLIDPGKSLNVGDTWSADIKADTKTGAVAAKADYKVIGEEKVGDLDTVKVQMTIKETGGTDPASSDSTVWLDKKDGSVVKKTGKWINAPFPGAPGPINATITETRES